MEERGYAGWRLELLIHSPRPGIRSGAHPASRSYRTIRRRVGAAGAGVVPAPPHTGPVAPTVIDCMPGLNWYGWPAIVTLPPVVAAPFWSVTVTVPWVAWVRVSV